MQLYSNTYLGIIERKEGIGEKTNIIMADKNWTYKTHGSEENVLVRFSFDNY